MEPDLEEMARPHIIEALQAMLTHAERMPLRFAHANGSGLTLTLQHGHVRCVLVADLPGAPAVLSPRELQVARLVARGSTNRAIAARLEISAWTVSTHLRRIFAKLRVGTRAEMVNALFAVAASGMDQRSGEVAALPTVGTGPLEARTDQTLAVVVASR
jgi:DNA-binding CsgD family transcriptional regulator